MALLGTTTRQRSVLKAGRKFVEDSNGHSAAFAYRYLFLPGQEVTWTTPDGSRGDFDGLKSYLAAGQAPFARIRTGSGDRRAEYYSQSLPLPGSAIAAYMQLP